MTDKDTTTVEFSPKLLCDEIINIRREIVTVSKNQQIVLDHMHQLAKHQELIYSYLSPKE